MESEKIHEFLKTPPIKSEGKMWNFRFLQRIEKLNEAYNSNDWSVIEELIQSLEAEIDFINPFDFSNDEEEF